MDKERLRWLIIGQMPNILYKISQPPENQDKIAKIRQLLETRRNLSYIFVSNHISTNDPLLTAYMVSKIDPMNTRSVIAPASSSHLKNSVFGLLNMFARSIGIETVGIVQAYQLNGINQDFANNTHLKLFRRVRQLHDSGQPIGLLIYPEGHRSETGQLATEGLEGVVRLGALMTPVIYVPIGNVYRDKYNRSGLNFGREVELIIGETLIQETPRPRVSLDSLMENLADVLPPEMRGRWK